MTKELTQVRKQEGKSPKGKGPKMAESTLVSSQEGDQSVEKSGLNVEREFFKSVQVGKDGDPSWKKQIYKVIARLDDYVPEFFKSRTFLDQLE